MCRAVAGLWNGRRTAGLGQPCNPPLLFLFCRLQPGQKGQGLVLTRIGPQMGVIRRMKFITHSTYGAAGPSAPWIRRSSMICQTATSQ